MTQGVACSCCGAQFRLPDTLWQKRVAGRVVTIPCRKCKAPISIDGRDASTRATPEVDSSACAPALGASPRPPADGAAPQRGLTASPIPPASKQPPPALAAPKATAAAVLSKASTTRAASKASTPAEAPKAAPPVAVPKAAPAAEAPKAAPAAEAPKAAPAAAAPKASPAAEKPKVSAAGVLSKASMLRASAKASSVAAASKASVPRTMVETTLVSGVTKPSGPALNQALPAPQLPAVTPLAVRPRPAPAQNSTRRSAGLAAPPESPREAEPEPEAEGSVCDEESIPSLRALSIAPEAGEPPESSSALDLPATNELTDTCLRVASFRPPASASEASARAREPAQAWAGRGRAFGGAALLCGATLVLGVVLSQETPNPQAEAAQATVSSPRQAQQSARAATPRGPGNAAPAPGHGEATRMDAESAELVNKSAARARPHDQQRMEFALSWARNKVKAGCRGFGVAPPAVTLNVTFAADGKVSQVTIQQERRLNGGMAQCLRSYFRGILIPPFEGAAFTVTERVVFY